MQKKILKNFLTKILVMIPFSFIILIIGMKPINCSKKVKEKCKSKIGRSCVLLDCQKLTKLKQAGSNTEG